MKILSLFLLFFTFLEADWKSQRENLEYCYIQEPFRIFYSLRGEHKLHQQQDHDQNDIPDLIDEIIDQLKNAHIILSQQRGLTSPLLNKRYISKAKYIDIHMLHIDHNGLAGDAIVNYNYSSIQNKYPSLSMSLSTKLSPTNLTPTHELIHLYQNGYSMIKTRWYTEGLARLLEDLSDTRKQKSIPLPATENELRQLFKKTYDNYRFFKRFEEKCDQSFIKKFLEQLSLQDLEIEKRYNYKHYQWQEHDQKSDKNTKFILKAFNNTIKKSCPLTNEIQNFLQISR